MKRMTKKMIPLLLFVLGFQLLGADEIALSGIDSRALAIRGQVDLYVVVTDETGRPVNNLASDDFVVREAPGSAPLGDPIRLSDFSPAGQRPDGLVFQMLIDDSGSMYDGPDGRATPSPDATRAAMARREAQRFLDDLGSSMDRAGLAVFGTRYQLLAGPRSDRSSLIDRLGYSGPPESEEAYTELYASIVEASSTLSDQRGRRIVILFSDGENFPYAEKTGRPHPDYGKQEFTPDDALDALLEEAVTLYAIRFGANRDEELGRIARATGGLVYDVGAEQELSGLYAAIRNRVNQEYRLSYRPRPTGSESTRARAELVNGPSTVELSFPSGILLGAPSSKNQALLFLLMLPVAALLMVVLWRIKVSRKNETVSLERIRPVGGGATVVALTSGKTVISPGDGGASTTIVAAGDKKPREGTLVVEKGSDGRWKISSDDGVWVNNKKQNQTVRPNGDVIRAGNELIVFDDGDT